MFKINDTVHGHMQFKNPLLRRIIDTPELQRLRHLKQMYPSSYVYPSACHTRFEHSIGVCHLAGKMVDSLMANTPDLEITSREKLCVMIAGLCHDLGHGPMSHTWEKFVHDSGDEEWKHEKGTVDMLDQLLANIGDHGLDPDEIDMIKAMILGNVINNKHYLFEIVNNQFCDIDVDKWDYLLRDSQQTNIPSGFDYSRLMAGVRVTEHCEGNQNIKHITYRDNDNININRMYMDRANIHHFVCQHKTVIIVEAMLLDAVKIANESDQFKITDTERRLSEAHTNMKAYLNTTDHIVEDIYQKGPQRAKDIIHRIKKRDLYKKVYVKTLVNERQFSRYYKNFENRKKIRDALKKEFRSKCICANPCASSNATNESCPVHVDENPIITQIIAKDMDFAVLGRKFAMGNEGKLSKTLFHNKNGKLVKKPLSLFTQAGRPEAYWLGELHICVKTKVTSNQLQNMKDRVKRVVDEIIDEE